MAAYSDLINACIDLTITTNSKFLSFFPTELKRYGLNEVILRKSFLRSASGLDLQLGLEEIPTLGFYRELHNFLKRCPVSNGETKSTIGKFYIAIDPNLHKKSLWSGRPDIYTSS